MQESILGRQSRWDVQKVVSMRTSWLSDKTTATDQFLSSNHIDKIRKHQRFNKNPQNLHLHHRLGQLNCPANPKSTTSPSTLWLRVWRNQLFEDFSPILFTISFWHFMCSPDEDDNDSDDDDMLFAISSICWIFRKKKRSESTRSKQTAISPSQTVFFSLFCVRFFKFPSKKKSAKRTRRPTERRRKEKKAIL